MQGYVVSRPVTLRSPTQVKHISASATLDEVAVADVQINALNEFTLAREQLQRENPGVPAADLIKGVPHERLAQWPHFPMVLGRLAASLGEERDVLQDQLRMLKARHPRRQHFRLLINNGFGTNLGDTLMGLTAFRSVWPLLKANFQSVSVDVLMGWAPLGAVTRLLMQCDGLESVLHQGPTLQALARYQGMIDTSGLIALPRYGTMPAVDWYLWWMGLDPKQVGDAEKRNRIALDPLEMETVAARLGAVAGPRILLNPTASAALRSIPEPVFQSLAQALLDADPAVQVLFDKPVAFEHPRALHLSDLITSPERLAALVAQVDGVITPDTYLQHVADATATPACTLCSSIPADFFRYYPLGRALMVPGADRLPGWGQTKVSEADWAAMKPAYDAAWARLDPGTVLAALAQARAARARGTQAEGPRIDAIRPAFQTVLAQRTETGRRLLAPLRQTPDGVAAALQDQLFKLGGQIVVSGDSVALLGAGAGELAVELAQRVAPAGRLVAFEARRLIHQILCANLAGAGCDCAETHPVLPVGTRFGQSRVPRLMPQDEHAALAAFNQQVSEPVVSWPLDLLALPQCRLIVMQSPVPLLAALKGALKTVTRLRPTVVAGLVRPDEQPGWLEALQGLHYTIRFCRLVDLDEALSKDPVAHDAGLSIVVAEPQTRGAETGALE